MTSANIANPTTAKYKAKTVYWNLVTKNVVSAQSVEQYRVNGKLKLPECICRFDSQHEFKVYLELVRMYGADNVIRQYPVEIYDIGYCYPRGKTWRVDFAIKLTTTSYLPSLYVEAKGAFLSEFAFTLAAFENKDPDGFDNLFIVFGNKLPKDNRVLNSLLKSPLASQLLTLPELKNTIKLA